ncbi:MAG: hypothetical protein HPY59_11285 [Anaerolineae bacterium]|nr:hypothetical protein [Anaerolineae bacterium]
MLIFEAKEQIINWEYRDDQKSVSGSVLPASPSRELLACIPENPILAYVLPHGMDRFTAAVNRLDANRLRDLEDCGKLLPEENQIVVEWARFCLDNFPKHEHYMLCETALFHDLPSSARFYALPHTTTGNIIRRYGSDGLCHQAALDHILGLMGRQPARLVSIHLSDRPNIASFYHGHPVETTAGFTSFEGIVSMHGIGDIDATITLDLLKKGLATAEVRDIFTKKSGLSALKGQEIHITDLLRGQLAPTDPVRNLFVASLLKAIGAALAALNGAEVMLWTVENIPIAIDFIGNMMKRLQFLGIQSLTVPLKGDHFWELTHKNSPLQVYVRQSNRWQELETLVKKSIS